MLVWVVDDRCADDGTEEGEERRRRREGLEKQKTAEKRKNNACLSKMGAANLADRSSSCDRSLAGQLGITCSYCSIACRYRRIASRASSTNC